MTKVEVLVKFRGVNYNEIFEQGSTYTLDDARANTLASRGLVKIIGEVKVQAKTEAPAGDDVKQETEVEDNPNEEIHTEAPAEETPKDTTEDVPGLKLTEEKKTRRGRASK